MTKKASKKRTSKFRTSLLKPRFQDYEINGETIQIREMSGRELTMFSETSQDITKYMELLSGLFYESGELLFTVEDLAEMPKTSVENLGNIVVECITKGIKKKK